MKNKDIVVVGLQPYDMEIGSNCVNIAEEFSKQNRVLYVNYPLDRGTIRREAGKPNIRKRIEYLNENKAELKQIHESFWNLYPNTVLESINGIPFTPLFRIFNFINNKRFAKQIKNAINQLGFKNFYLFIDSDMFRSFYLKQLLKPTCTIYYTRDNMLSVPFWKKHGQFLEPELMRSSDLVVANSAYLRDIAAQYNKNSFDVGQGCDVTAFDRNLNHTVPEDLSVIPQPRIGYIGALYGLRLDPEILSTIARNRPDWSVVLIGPEDDTFKKSELHQLKNVYFLGLKDGAVLPAYLSGFDVALNPQILNEVTIGNYPRKIDEYLAMGKPVVATKTRAMDLFKDHTYLAAHKEDYPGLIQKALEENSSQKEQERILFARSHTWENSVKAIYAAIEKVMKEQL